MDATSPRSPYQGRSLISLFADLWRESARLVRGEAELAKAELSAKVSEVQSGFASLAIGGAILFAGFLVLLAAAVAGLARVLPPENAAWLAPLLVGLVVALIGSALIAKARRDLKASRLKPSHTLASLRRDTELAKEHLR
jgi:drug/metabolite transporter (DMT)-like permease